MKRVLGGHGGLILRVLLILVAAILIKPPPGMPNLGGYILQALRDTLYAAFQAFMQAPLWALILLGVVLGLIHGVVRYLFERSVEGRSESEEGEEV